MPHKMKYCPQAEAMLNTLKRNRGPTKYNNAGALHTHLAKCMKCGRDLEGEPWPPP